MNNEKDELKLNIVSVSSFGPGFVTGTFGFVGTDGVLWLWVVVVGVVGVVVVCVVVVCM